jgi:phosphatidate cytidylyltransferase
LAHADWGGFRLRVLSALVLIPPVLLAVWLGGWALAALVTLVAAGMGWEWARLTGFAAPLGMLLPCAAAVPVIAMAMGMAGASLVLAAAAVAVLWPAARRAGAPAPAWSALGTAWIALPCLAVVWLDRVGGWPMILWLFVTVWATDSGAFVAGRSLGGPRLAPRLSPNKTWAGFAGGAVLAALVGWATAALAHAAAAPLVAASVGLAVAAQAGDLAESMAKRRFGAKDSGQIIPGHGGLLDRLDGMLAAAALQWLLTLASGASPLLWRG